MHYLLKLFFPSWSLFDQPGDHFEIFYRQVGSDISGPWISMERPAKDRSLFQLFLNPTDSAWLFFFNQIDECCYRFSADENFSITTHSNFILIKTFLSKIVLNSPSYKVPLQLKIRIISAEGLSAEEFSSEVFEC